MDDDRTLWEAILGDGRPLLLLSGTALGLAGLFAVFQALTGHFLPHDELFLGMDAAELCGFHGCRIVDFMIHDRIAFGGAMAAIGALYLWLTEFPLRNREGWAWWAMLLSGIAGFGSFLTYLGTGYLDTWHGVATLALLPIQVIGMARSYTVVRPAPLPETLRAAHLVPVGRDREGVGRLLLTFTVIGLLSAGLVIMIGGMTRVFVPQDLQFMALEVAELEAISPRLVPLIAHDRAGFGGGIFSAGIVMAFALAFARPSRHLWQILLVAGSLGFGAAIGAHFPVGYVNLTHLLPAYVGATVFYLGLALTFHPWHVPSRPLATAPTATD